MEYVPEVDCSAVVVDLRGNFIHSVKVYVNASHTLIKTMSKSKHETIGFVT